MIKEYKIVDTIGGGSTYIDVHDTYIAIVDSQGYLPAYINLNQISELITILQQIQKEKES